MSKKILLPFLPLALVLAFLLASGQRSAAQPFSNSWINFTNTYYKFKIAREGIFRITKTQLDAIGMGSVSGSQFAVFREGQEVPVYTSTNGAFGGGDYIEFYAGKANGKMDAQLYPDPAFQPNTEVNIISDTAFYFLTFDNTVHQRLQLVNNSIPVPAPAPSAYCWAIAMPQEDIRNYWDPGRSHTNQDYFYSSDFDLGEGYAYKPLATSGSVTIPTPNAFTGGPQAIASFALAGHSRVATQHHPYVSLNGSNIFDSLVNSTFRMIKRSVNVSAALLGSGTSTMGFSDGFNFYILGASVRYPRTYNFSGNFSSKAAFQVPAADRYLEISGFTTGGQTARLYDLTNGKIYTGTESGGTVKFYLDASAAPRDMFLSNVAPLSNVTAMSPVTFRNYAASANQGDYIILSHKNYIEASPSYVNEFKNYRNSMAGGSHQSVVVDITELYDQFGYGFEYHPQCVKEFIAYANATWTVKPKFLFIIGKGVSYTGYASYKANAATISYSPIPTWGEPGADNLFSSYNNDQKPILATGRISAWNNQEIGNYLDKVKAYELAIKPLDIPTVAHEFWKKKALHIVGSTNISEQQMLLSSLNACADIFRDTLIGGMVTTIRKTSTDPVEQVYNARIDSLMNQGLGYTSFYGHGSSSGFDFNLNSPDNYNSAPRFPVFSAFACEVAHIFNISPNKTIGEQYLSSQSGGSIVMIAGNNTGWTGTLPGYMQNLYRSWGFREYGKTLGEQYQKNIVFLQNTYPGDDFMDIHTQSLLFQGDPGIALYNPDKPDFAVEASGLSSIPANVTTALNSFTIKAVVYSLGRSTHDSVWVTVKHTKPGSGAVLYADSVRIGNLLSSDTLLFEVPLDPNKDIGVNDYTVSIDAGEEFDELSEMNNQATLKIFIYSENLMPVYPKEFAIVHQQDVILKASTLNAFAPLRRYKLEIDTTELFNSSLKQSTEITSIGGIVKWKPAMVYQDSVVYYWRAAPDTLIEGAYSWSSSSFIYLANGSDGWNQSHYFQYKKNEPYTGLSLPEATRRFGFSPVTNIFKVEDKVVNPALGDYYNVRQSINDIVFDNYGCVFSGSIQVVVIDSVTGYPWRNTTAGLYGSAASCSSNPNVVRQMFEFSTADSVSRNNARLFIESVPDGCYIMLKNLIYNINAGPGLWNGKTIDDWKADTMTYGSGKSLYHAVKDLGFDEIDQFTYKRVFAFFRRKGVSTFPVTQQLSLGVDDKIQFEVPFLSYPDTGMMHSALVGPALEWQSLKWSTSAESNPVYDSPYVAVYGIDTLNNEALLYSGYSRDTSLSFIPAAQYPNLRLQWYSVDNITRTSPYLDYWRVLYSPVPEAALNAAAHFEFIDSLGEGQQGKLRVAIENLTPYPMDKMLVTYKMIDANNVKHDFEDRRYRALPGNDTLIADLDFDVSGYYGNNFLLVEANPDNDQPEQYHPNNLGYLPLHLEADKYNPLLDVTFDGVHILDKDIVSAKPFVKVLLRDENPYLPLNDTALMKLQLLYPNQSVPVDIPLDGTVCKFFPAQMVNGKKNEARLEFKPTLPEDGVYRLIVSGKDKVGNIAGNAIKYEVNFTVENKSSITNVLNYPNPFSTSTRFIFTMTGSEIPSQFKIQIITVTGKVIREIKKNELGDLHIGRNITEYRWDGRDEYGQLLGNGVYLYRVVTSIRGEGIEHRKNASVDKYFKNGYGKLYIMR